MMKVKQGEGRRAAAGRGKGVQSYLGVLTILSLLCVVLARAAGAFKMQSMSRSMRICTMQQGLHVRSLLGRTGGSHYERVREVRNGVTSDGRRRLLSMAELFGEKDDGASSSKGPPPPSGMFSRDGALKLVGYAAVAYIGKQFFNGGRYDEAPDLTGKVAVITGGNSGIGKETAIRLAQLGARVLIAVRNPQKGEAAVKEIKAAAVSQGRAARASTYKGPSVESLIVDLSDLKSVDAFANDLARRTNKVDILVNNAGVMAISNLQRTKEGFETHVGVNHLGHFHLTNRIFDLLKAAPTARIINVASEAHRFGGLDLNDLNYQSRPYKKWEAYGQSKLANILFTKELNRRLSEKGLDRRILTVACHPGVVRTELGRYLIEDIPSPAKIALAPLAIAGYYFTKSPKQGAQTQIYLSASPKFEERSGGGGQYFSDCKPKNPAKEAEDPHAASGLWTLSEKLTGASFTV